LGITARRIRTKVLIDTFVQWLRLCASGLIKQVDAGSIQIFSARLRHGVFCKIPGRYLRLTFKEASDAAMLQHCALWDKWK
jgi:hypothetical protein